MNCFRFVRTHHVLNREYEIHYILRFKYNFIEARGGKSVFDKVSSVTLIKQVNKYRKGTLI